MTHARITFIFTVLVTAMLSCCLSCGKTTSTKELTESSAHALIEQSYANSYYPVDLARLAPLFAKTRVDYKNVYGTKDEATMNVLLQHGLLEQHVEIVSYPNVSGIFTGEMHFAGAMRYEPENVWYNEYNLHMDADSNSFSGTLTSSYQKGRSADGKILPGPIEVRNTDKVTGTIQPDGVVFINGKYGKYNEEGATASLTLPGPYYKGEEWHLVGKANGNTQVKWYTYALTPEGHKQIEQTDRGLELRAGKFKIGEVTNLRLVTDTVATANFAWEASLNDLGKTLLPYSPHNNNLPANEIPKGVGTAAFAKKPDGTWFIDRDRAW